MLGTGLYPGGNRPIPLLSDSGTFPKIGVLGKVYGVNVLPSSAAGSTGERNTHIKSLCRRLVIQCFTRPFIEPTRHSIQRGLRVYRQVSAFGKVLYLNNL